jgi:hypothetical protein
LHFSLFIFTSKYFINTLAIVILRLLEKLKQTTIDSFATIEYFFEIEFTQEQQTEGGEPDLSYEALEILLKLTLNTITHKYYKLIFII